MAETNKVRNKVRAVKESKGRNRMLKAQKGRQRQGKEGERGYTGEGGAGQMTGLP